MQYSKRKRLSLNDIWGHFIKNTYVLVFHTDIAPARFLCALSAIAFGFLMLAPGVDLQEPEYMVLREIMNSSKWASLYLVIGFINMYTLIARVPAGWYTPVLAFTQMLLWLTTTVALAIPWINGYHHISAEGVVAWMAVWIMIRSHDGSEEDFHDSYMHYKDPEAASTA